MAYYAFTTIDIRLRVSFH